VVERRSRLLAQDERKPAAGGRARPDVSEPRTNTRSVRSLTVTVVLPPTSP
jgi:hypothetical protein